MKNHVDGVARSCFYQLRQLRSIRRSVPTDALHTLVHAFISSRIDYCNAVLYGATDAVIRRLQAVLHAAARLITGVRRNDHITPTLRDTLHWLPVSQRIAFLRSKLRWWHTTVSMAYHQFTDRLCSLSFSASLCWQRWHDYTTYSDRALWSAQFPRRGTPDLEHHLISRTVVLAANSSSLALRHGSLCKPTHKRRLWQLCLSGALQILDFWLIEWLIAYLWPTLSGDVEVIFY